MKEKNKKTVLVIDGGGRGSVLVDKYSQSKQVGKIIAIPGNDLMKNNIAKPVVIFPHLTTTSIPEILEICNKEKVDLADVAQDNAVQAGLVDALTQKEIPTVGPTKNAGRIEWDKAWARSFGNKYKLPQPIFKICTSEKEGIDYLKKQPNQPWFIKSAYLAEGKGALPAKNNQEALLKIKHLREKFPEASKTFLVEKWLKGDDDFAEEFSIFALCDGSNYKIIGCAQDHKRVNNYDEGENTGGMGCSTPPLILTPNLVQNIKKEILDKVVNGLQKETRPYKGVLYLGGMVVKQKNKLTPYVIEFNARWGDPEAQVILPGLCNDLFEVSMAVAQGNISSLNLQTDTKARVVITGALRGYPGNYVERKGKQIFGLEKVRKIDGIKLYGAAVKVEGEKYYANGGRLFYIVGEGKDVIEARKKAYQAMTLVHIEGNNLHYRTDIGWRDVERLVKEINSKHQRTP